MAPWQEVGKAEARRKEAAKLNTAIDVKHSYIRYLAQRAQDPQPIITEIARHQKHADKHLEEVARLEAVLEDLPAELLRAELELKALLDQKPVKPAKATRIAKLKLQAADIQAALAELLEETHDTSENM